MAMSKAFDLVIKNVRVVRPKKTSVDCLDIAIRDGKIEHLAPAVSAEQAEQIFDGGNHLAFPGCVDAQMRLQKAKPQRWAASLQA
jgi:allantoinase